MAKTKVIIATANDTKRIANERKEMVQGLSKVFGKPQEAKQKKDGSASYAWQKSSVQLYFEANGTVGVFIQFADLPVLEFDKASFKTAQSKLQKWCTKALQGMDKQIAAIEATKERMETLRYAVGYEKPRRPRPMK